MCRSNPTRGRRRRRVTGGSRSRRASAPAARRADQAQLNVPGSPAGAIGMPPEWPGITAPSQQGAEVAAGPHGSQTGPQGAAIGAWHGSP